MKRILCLLGIVLLNSCVREKYETPVGVLDTFPVTVEMDMPQESAMRRSSFSEEELMKITDLNVFVYHDGVLLNECCRYFTDMDRLMLSFPSDRDGFNIYMLANVGKVIPPVSESDISEIAYVVNTYDNFRSMGFPAAESWNSYMKGDLAHFKLKRLIGQYNIRMRTSARDAVYNVTDARLLNCAKDVYPFSTETKATVFTSSGVGWKEAGDVLSADDIATLNSGGTVSLYFLENLQGVLLPDNTDRKAKIPSSLDLVEEGLADRCTYIEITADVTTSAAKYKDGKYRFYLGQNQTTDFSIKRNTLYNVILDFTQNMVCEEEWRIETGEPEVVGVKMDKNEAMVVKGTEDIIFVQSFGNDGELLDFDIERLSSGYLASVEKLNTYYLGQSALGEAVGFRFTSNAPLCGLYPYDEEPTYKTEKFRIISKETYNGKPLYEKEITVRIYDKLFPLLIKLELNPHGAYEAIVRGQNPMKLGLSLSSTYTYGGSSTETGIQYRCGYVTPEGHKRTSSVVGPQGISMAIYMATMTPQNLTRINFSVKGMSTPYSILTSDPVISYPRFCQTKEIYMGDGSEAFFGPGADLCPGKLPNMADDSQYYMCMYTSTTSSIGLAYNTNNSDYWTDLKQDGFYRSKVIPYSLLSDQYEAQWESYYFYAPWQGVHSKEYNPNSHFYSDYSQYEETPFYFVNGGLISDYTHVHYDGTLVRYPNESVRWIYYTFYGPGRDLFAENKNGDVINGHHEMQYALSTWKPLVGSAIRVRQLKKYYTGQLYMTINGASAWCGNDITQSGFFPETE